MNIRRQPIRPLPVILPPLADELLSSWIDRHAAFIGVSGRRLLRHYLIDVPSVRDLDLSLSRRHAALLADALRCSQYQVRSMTQSRGGKVRSGLVAIRTPSQFCRACAQSHLRSVATRGARLRSWMEGWRITCPVCGAALEDFRLMTRIVRADPGDAFLARVDARAREGEQVMHRASWQHSGGCAHVALMRGLLLPQTPRAAATGTPARRLLDVVVPGSDEFFGRLPPGNWPCSNRSLPLSVRIPVLAGVAAVSACPEYWTERLIGAAARRDQPGMLQCVGALATADRAGPRIPRAVRFRRLL